MRRDSPPRDSPEDPQVILITGCSSGIGLATARAFLQAGYRVAATSRSPRASQPLSELEGGSAGWLVTRPLDVREDGDRAAAVDWVAESFGRLDVLVNNAGVLWTGEFESADYRDFESVLQTNVVGPMDLTRRAVPYLAERKDGRVINISAIGGVLPVPFLSLYVAAKHSIEGLSASLDIELMPHGIRVLTLLPGLVRTAIVSRSRGTDEQRQHCGPVTLATSWLDELEQRVQTHGVSASEIADQAVSLANMTDPPQKTLHGTSRASIGDLVAHLLMVSQDLRADHQEFMRKFGGLKRTGSQVPHHEPNEE